MERFNLIAGPLMQLLEQHALRWNSHAVPDGVAEDVLLELSRLRQCSDPSCIARSLQRLQLLESRLPSTDVTLIHALTGTLDSWLELNPSG